MRKIRSALSQVASLVCCGLLCGSFGVATPAAGIITGSDGKSEIGTPGGRLLFSVRTEPKTLNPITSLDTSSRQILGLINADLIHINRATQKTEPALAQAWTISKNQREYTLTLRHGLRFSDGHPFGVEDVLFTFRVYLDEKTHSPQRDLLLIAGKPIEVRQIGPDMLRFILPDPYAAGERIFDGVNILPKHLLEKAFLAGKVADSWPLTVSAQEIAGLGPFRLKQYVPGQQLVLERNPYYWQRDSAGNQLPYLKELIAVSAGGAEGEAMRFASGAIDIADRLSPQDFATLQQYAASRHLRLFDLGPGLELDFLFFNLNGDKKTKPTLPSPQSESTFRSVAFRQAISKAIDRQALVRLAFRGRAFPLSTFVPPGDSRWVNRNIPGWQFSKQESQSILKAAGFTWDQAAHLKSPSGEAVSFSIVFSASNPRNKDMAALIGEDLENLGIQVNLVSLEFHSLLDRIFRTFDYEAAIMALVGEDTDPNSEVNIWSSQGSTHVWDLSQSEAAMPWQKEVDRLMRQQMITPDYGQRKALYDRVQSLVFNNLPIIPLISPNILVGAKQNLGNFQPVILGDHTLWNAQRLYIRSAQSELSHQNQ